MFSVVVGDCMLLLSSVTLALGAVDSVDWFVNMDSLVPSVEVIDSAVCSVFISSVRPSVLSRSVCSVVIDDGEVESFSAVAGDSVVELIPSVVDVDSALAAVVSMSLVGPGSVDDSV